MNRLHRGFNYNYLHCTHNYEYPPHPKNENENTVAPVGSIARCAGDFFRQRGVTIPKKRGGNALGVPTRKKIIEYLGDNYTLSDNQIINLYVDAHKYYRRLKKEVDKEPLMMTHTNKAGATNYIKNPLTIELTKQYQTLNNLLKSLGLTPAQREMLKPDGGDPGDDFDNF